jgi:tetratricopeptide (TPR) repeat protein
MESGAASVAAHFYWIAAQTDPDMTRRATAAGAQARALYLARDINRANPLLAKAARRFHGLGLHADALRLQIKRIEALADLGEPGLSNLLKNLGSIKSAARDRGDWAAVALALDAQLQLLHRLGDGAGIGSLFNEMREVARRGSPEAALVSNTGLALAVVFGDPEEALEAARRALALTTDLPDYRLRALLRLMVVLQYRGMLELPGSKATVQEARNLARASGDVIVRYSIESNLATASLDAGDLEAAEAQMAKSRALAESAEMDMNRCIHANNRAELALAKGDYDEAQAAYGEASSYVGASTPPYMMDLVHAGMGLCALETGNLAEAYRREQALRATPSRWHCDPTTILAFRARLLECRQDRAGAIDLLDKAASDLEGRLVLACLKVRSIQVRLLQKEKCTRARAIALDCRRVAEGLGLAHRTREFARLADADIGAGAERRTLLNSSKKHF